MVRGMTRAAAAFGCFIAIAAAQPVYVSIAPEPLHSNVSLQFLGVNVDTASINHNLDLTDPYLINLFRNLGAATNWRIGGSAANGIQYVANSPCWGGSCPGYPAGMTIINDAFLQQLSAFVTYTNMSVQWGIQYIPRNLTNAAALLSAVQRLGVPIHGWSLGNELIGGGSFNSSLYGQDYASFRALVSSFPAIGQAIAGPSGAGFPGAPALTPFIEQAYVVPSTPALDEWSFHAYSFKNCSLAVYADLPSIDHISTYYREYTGLRDSIAPGLPLYLEEFATQAGGGCANLSASFVSGFWYLRASATAGEAGIARVTRQDVVGWSFDNGVSHYPLAGPPGWTNASVYGGPPLPHPDYFTTLLFKGLVGNSVLNVTVGEAQGGLGVHAWCARQGASTTAGAVTLLFVNVQGEPVTLALSTSTSSSAPPMAVVPRTEFILTAVPTSQPTSGEPPAYLLSDELYLNSAASPLSLSPDGSPPASWSWPREAGGGGGTAAYPPGRTVTDPSQPVVLPPWAYGFVVLHGAAAPACMA